MSVAYASKQQLNMNIADCQASSKGNVQSTFMEMPSPSAATASLQVRESGIMSPCKSPADMHNNDFTR
jgi:hypothetical protein